MKILITFLLFPLLHCTIHLTLFPIGDSYFVESTIDNITFILLVSTYAPSIMVPTKQCVQCDKKTYDCSDSYYCKNETTEFYLQNRWGTYHGNYLEDTFSFFLAEYTLHFIGLTNTTYCVDMVFGLNLFQCTEYCYFDDLLADKRVDYKSFAISLNMSGVSELILGGYNASYNLKNAMKIPVYKDAASTNWSIGINGYDLTQYSVKSKQVAGADPYALLDTSYGGIALPHEAYIAYLTSLSKVVFCTIDSSGYVLIEANNLNEILNALSDVVLSNQNYQLITPAKNLISVINSTDEYVFANLLVRDGNNAYILGRPFLKQYHVFFDYDKKTVSFMDKMGSSWTDHTARVYIAILGGLALIIILAIVITCCNKRPSNLRTPQGVSLMG